MKTFIISVTEAPSEEGRSTVNGGVEFYRRRIEAADIQPVLTSLDASLKAMPKPRAKRSDSGKKRGDA